MEEIERKFRVCGDVFKTLATKKIRITQGYLCSATERTVRVFTLHPENKKLFSKKSRGE